MAYIAGKPSSYAVSSHVIHERVRAPAWWVGGSPASSNASQGALQEQALLRIQNRRLSGWDPEERMVECLGIFGEHSPVCK